MYLAGVCVCVRVWAMCVYVCGLRVCTCEGMGVCVRGTCVYACGECASMYVWCVRMSVGMCLICVCVCVWGMCMYVC